MSGDISKALRRVVADRAYHVCEYCLVHEDDVYHGCEVDHVRSGKHGGVAVPENLAFACFHCNRHKGTDLGSVSLRNVPKTRDIFLADFGVDRVKAHIGFTANVPAWTRSAVDTSGQH